MADFDTIYEERDDDDDPIDNFSVIVPDPIIIRGAGNVTMYGVIPIILFEEMELLLMERNTRFLF